MWTLALWIIPYLSLCCAQHLACNATQLPQGTFYSVSKMKATECPYSWMNSTGHVLANQKDKMGDLVFNSSIGTLFTRTCFSQLNYTRDCVSEGIQQTAYCFIDCIIQAPLEEKGISRQYWSNIASVSFLVLVLLLGLLSCVLRRNR
ncbi:uncharacterized protein LOC143421768 [Maylandia zebra]|uniref:uncharacterized protein LOC143421768 n=1 Tax=Maylandia zebra TaxID=106582 RepID=UPI00403C9B96